MSYKVNYDELDMMKKKMDTQVAKWQTELEDLYKKVEIVVNSANISGAAADNVKKYMESTHYILTALIVELIRLHTSNFYIYKNEYHTKIDLDLHAQIIATELEEYRELVKKQNESAIGISDEVNRVLSGISDIFAVKNSDIERVDNAHQSAIKILQMLDDSILTLEKNHYETDFVSTREMLSSLKKYIAELTSQNRKYKTDFTIQSLASSSTFHNLYSANVMVQEELQEKEVAITTALKNEEIRADELYLERKRIAEEINWGVTAACILGSIVAIVATGGAATPLVVGTVSAVSGVIMAGTGNLTGQYVEHGNIIENAADIDWYDATKDVVVGGITGFITGYVGGSISKGVSTFAKGTPIGKTIFSSTSTWKRVGANALIGSTSESISGMGTRGVNTFITTGGDTSASLKAAFDTKCIMQDAAIGGFSDGFGEYSSIKKMQKAQNTVDAYTTKYNQSHNPLEAGKQQGLENLVATKNNGVDFSQSEYICRTKAGGPIEIEINATGNYKTDRILIRNEILKKYNIDIDELPKKYIIYNLDDYNLMTNTKTIQIVDRKAVGLLQGRMSASAQYARLNGKGYGKVMHEVDYKEVNIGKYFSIVDSNNSKLDTNLKNLDRELGNSEKSINTIMWPSFLEDSEIEPAW